MSASGNPPPKNVVVGTRIAKTKRRMWHSFCRRFEEAQAIASPGIGNRMITKTELPL